jgi:hypothetical protein
VISIFYIFICFWNVICPHRARAHTHKEQKAARSSTKNEGPFSLFSVLSIWSCLVYN